MPEVERWQKGEFLTARLLNERTTDELNKLIARVGPPRQNAAPIGDQETTRRQDDPLEEEEEIVPEAPQQKIYGETGRVTSTVRIEDPNDSEVFVDVERIDQIQFSTADGEVFTLVFSNT